MIIINLQLNEWVEKWAKQFLEQHLGLCIRTNGSATHQSPRIRYVKNVVVTGESMSVACVLLLELTGGGQKHNAYRYI